MIHTIASLLTTFAMLLHAVLGCCAHHDHGHQVNAAGAADNSTPVAAHRHHGHQHHSHGAAADASPATAASLYGGCCSTSDSGSHPEPVESCGEGRCLWISTESPAAIPAGLSGLDDGPVPMAMAAGIAVSTRYAGHCPASPPGDARASGRRRALYQIWRI